MENFQQCLEMEGVSPQTSMAMDNESRKESVQLTPLLTTKHTTKIVTWNIRTMCQAGKTSQIASEMNQYNLSLIGLSETRWTQSGKTHLSSGETIIYSAWRGQRPTHRCSNLAHKRSRQVPHGVGSSGCSYHYSNIVQQTKKGHDNPMLRTNKWSKTTNKRQLLRHITESHQQTEEKRYHLTDQRF